MKPMNQYCQYHFISGSGFSTGIPRCIQANHPHEVLHCLILFMFMTMMTIILLSGQSNRGNQLGNGMTRLNLLIFWGFSLV